MGYFERGLLCALQLQESCSFSSEKLSNSHICTSWLMRLDCIKKTRPLNTGKENQGLMTNCVNCQNKESLFSFVDCKASVVLDSHEEGLEEGGALFCIPHKISNWYRPPYQTH